MRHRVFVYGSLKRGFRHHDQLARGQFEASLTTTAKFRLVLWESYPALVRGGELPIVGETYWVDDAVLAHLDDFEEHPRVYQRAWIELADQSRAQAYLMPAERTRHLPDIPGGVWTEQ